MTERVLVPHDLTDLCDLALRQVERLGVPAARVHVAHVLPRVDLAHATLVWPTEDDEPRRRHATGALRERLDRAGLGAATTHVLIGDPGSRVVELARQIDATLIVMPSHGRKGVERLVLGSVAEHVVRFSACPVLVLPREGLPETLSPPTPVEAREDQLVTVAEELTARATASRAFLTAARVEVAPLEDLEWWEDALQRQLLDRGIEFVDLVVVHGPSARARVVDAQLEERFT